MYRCSKFDINLTYICSMINRWSVFLFFFSAFYSSAQYTDQINSNRPGASIGAFAVGKNVVQAEAGAEFRNYNHAGYNNSTFRGGSGFLGLRWGFLSETLELTYEGQYLYGNLNSKLYSQPKSYTTKGFLQNFIGLKYLIYDPFKKERTTNVYSWKANNGFKLRELIPAVSITLGTNINFEKNNPFPYSNVFGKLYRPIFFQNLVIQPDEEGPVSMKGTLATQSHFLGTWVFVTNFTYDRYLSDYPQINYILTLTHTLDPLWSVYLEHQAERSDLYRDKYFRLGAAYLWNDNLQIEATLGSSLKNTPNLIFVNAGASYRLDFHKDFISAEEIQQKESKSQERQLKKALKGNSKGEMKRSRKAKRN